MQLPLLLLLGLIFSVSAIPPLPNLLPPSYSSSKGFTFSAITTSYGGKAICISGNVPVKASAANTKLNLTNPVNQSASTEIFVEYFQPTSNLANSTLGGKETVSGTYNINAVLCLPTSPPAASVPTLHFLIHGINFDKQYWDIPGSSYVEAAVEAGYATFSYDRLGVGASDHPDPIQVVQSGLQVEIAHQLIQSLRSGSIRNESFSKVVGVGHSYGSIQSIGLAAQYP
jgi:hypothetical protein